MRIFDVRKANAECTRREVPYRLTGINSQEGNRYQRNGQIEGANVQHLPNVTLNRYIKIKHIQTVGGSVFPQSAAELECVFNFSIFLSSLVWV